ncbi:MAG: type I glyceraldehyde-3-phosphate dehydrogenase [Candidatus Binatia bacterium]
MANVAINGFGRIGRAVFKLLADTSGLNVVAINDLVPPENLAYLLQYDTVYGRYPHVVQVEGNALAVNGKSYKLLGEHNPVQLPWQDLNVDIVFECTGVFNQRDDLQKHVQAGAKYVLLSAPTKSEEVPTLVYGVNTTDGGTQIVSCASCTTNCITPVVEVMGRRIGIKKAIMTTVHAYTATQSVVDSPNKKTRRGRAAAANLVPSSTGAALATTKALPQYEGKFDGVAVRAPVPVGSLADIVFVTKRPTTESEVNAIFTEEATSERYRGILGVTTDPIVSSDVIRQPYASIVDLDLTQVVDGDLVKVMSWYDNEWGYAAQMVREAQRLVREG